MEVKLSMRIEQPVDGGGPYLAVLEGHVDGRIEATATVLDITVQRYPDEKTEAFEKRCFRKLMERLGR